MSHAPVAGIPMSLVLVGACLAAAANPPFIVYGGSRASTEVIETPKGGVPVDQGIAWEGVKVYLSIMGDLVAVDAGTGKFLWCRFVGAFWNEVGFEEVEVIRCLCGAVHDEGVMVQCDKCYVCFLLPHCSSHLGPLMSLFQNGLRCAII